MTAAGDDLVDVHILGLPVALQVQASAAVDGLLREFFHLADGDGVPARLLALHDELQGRFDAYTATARTRLEEAARSDEGTLDLHYRVPPEAVDAADAVRRLLDEADEYCATGELLALTPPPEVVAYRRWMLGEFIRQRDGEPPCPWPDHLAQLGRTGA